MFILPTQWLRVERTNIKFSKKGTIVHLSDFHVEKNRIRPRTLEKILKRENITFIALTGDYASVPSEAMKLVPYLDVLSKLSVPIVAVWGNHDDRHQSKRITKTLFDRYGVIVLENEVVHLKGFEIAGVGDVEYGNRFIDKTLNGLSNLEGAIMLAHDPSYSISTETKVGLVLSGHYHGKQIDIPWFNRFGSEKELLNKGIYKGLHKLPGGLTYISKGLGQTSWNIRFRVRSEIAIHNLES